MRESFPALIRCEGSSLILCDQNAGAYISHGRKMDDAVSPTQSSLNLSQRQISGTIFRPPLTSVPVLFLRFLREDFNT